MGLKYLAADNRSHASRDPVNNSVNEGKVEGGHANRADEQVPVTAASHIQVHVLVMHLRARRILGLEPEGRRDGGREGSVWDRTLRRHERRAREEYRCFTLHRD